METETLGTPNTEKEPRIFTSPAEFFTNYTESEFFKKEYKSFLDSESKKKDSPKLNEDQLLYKYLRSDEAEDHILRYADSNKYTIKIPADENSELTSAVRDYTDTIKEKKKAEKAGDRFLLEQLNNIQRKYHNEAGVIVTKQLHKSGLIKSTAELYGDSKDETSYPQGLGRGIVLVIAGREKRS